MGGWAGSTKCALVGSGVRHIGALIREGLQDGFGAAGSRLLEQGKGVFHGFQAVIGLALVALDSVEKGPHFDEFVAHFDELKVQKFLLRWHD